MNKLVKKGSLLAATALALVSAVCGVTAIKAQPVNAADVNAAANIVEEYSSTTTQNSSTLQRFSISSFESLADFTNYFSFTYDNVEHKTFNLTDVATYNSSTKKINIKNDEYVTDIDNTSNVPYFAIQFNPDGLNIGGSEYGKTKLGNFEVKITLDGVDASSGENVYFGSRITSLYGEYLLAHESDNIGQNVRLRACLTGGVKEGGMGADGVWTMTPAPTMTRVDGKDHHFEEGKVTSGMTVTVGYINNYCYMYADTTGGAKDGGVIIAKAPLMEIKDSALDGNQNFAIYFTGSRDSQTEVNISSFSYERLDTEFDINALESETLAAVQARVGTNVVAEWAEGYTESATNKSQHLDLLSINRFNSTADFTDWFALDYLHRTAVLGTDYSMSVSNGALTIEALPSKTVGFRLLPFDIYGNAYLGNFEVKIKIEQTYSGGSRNVYFGSRTNWSNNGLNNEGLAAALYNGTTLDNTKYTSSSATNATIQSGAYQNITSATTLTLGYIDNACYFYTGNAPASDLSNVTIATKTYFTGTTYDRNGGQMFGIYLHTGTLPNSQEKAGAKITISSFSYRRLDENKYPYSAPNATLDASVAAVKEYLKEGEIYPHATFTENTFGTAKNSATLQNVNVEEMDSLDSFTDYFQLAYGSRHYIYDYFHLWSTLSYNSTNKSVQIIAPRTRALTEEEIAAGKTKNYHTEWRFMPQETYGTSYLGNYEMHLTIKANSSDMMASRNVYIGNYNSGTDNYTSTNALFKLYGGTVDGVGVWTINGDSQNYVPVEEELRITIGFVNGFYYYYVNEPNANYGIKYKQLASNADATLEGNQVFALALTEGTKIEVCSFSYERLSSTTYANAVNTFKVRNDVTDENMKTQDEYKFIEERMAARIREYELGVLQTQEYAQINGASVRLSDPYGLRFSATFREDYINFWEQERGYKVELGVLVAPTQLLKNGALTFENGNYTLGNQYIKIVCEDGDRKYAIIDGYARVNGVLKVNLSSHYGVKFTGVPYLRILKGDGTVVYTKYTTSGIYYYTNEGSTEYVASNAGNQISRSMRYVVREALADKTAEYTEREINYLKSLDTGAKLVIDGISALSKDEITAENYASIEAEVNAVKAKYDALTAYDKVAGLEMTEAKVKALVTNYKVLENRIAALNAYKGVA